MQTPDFILARIPDFADYRDETARHLADRQIRSYLGRALSDLRERLTASASGASSAFLDALDRLISRCEFTDQRLVKSIEHAELGDEDVARLHEHDQKLIEAADSSPSVKLENVTDFLASLTEAFERRDTFTVRLAPAVS